MFSNKIFFPLTLNFHKMVNVLPSGRQKREYIPPVLFYYIMRLFVMLFFSCLSPSHFLSFIYYVIPSPEMCSPSVPWIHQCVHFFFLDSHPDVKLRPDVNFFFIKPFQPPTLQECYNT